MARPAVAEIDLSALRHNFQVAKNYAPNSKAIAVVKANAYGHGAVEIARALEPLTPAFGVACIEEALELRAAGMSKPILLMEGIFTADEVSLAAQHNFWLAVENQFQCDAILRAKLKTPLNIWLKIDTGMHRLGVSPNSVVNVYRRLATSSNVQDKLVLMTHLACADEPNRTETLAQLSCFEQCFGSVVSEAQRLNKTVDASIANSAGTLAWPQTHKTWIRPGYMLYGGSPLAHANNTKHFPSLPLRAVMTLKTAVIALRTVTKGEAVGYGGRWQAPQTSVIATLALGYADGYPRSILPDTPVLVHGQRVPIVGNVSMDMITIDVTTIANVKIGDEVILWGKHLPVDEVARQAATIGYELIARMPLRVPRVYIN